jgi:hypothetical protein
LIVYRYNDFSCGYSSSWTPVVTFFSDWSNMLLVAQFFLRYSAQLVLSQ